MPETARLAHAGTRERLADRLSGDELLAEQAHRAIDRAAYQRLATARDRARERVRQAGLVVQRDEPAGDDQPPGRRVNEYRGVRAEMRVPVAVADLVADQRIARRIVGDAQQRLGQAHQRNAFLRRQRELGKQSLHEPFTTDAAFAQAVREQLRASVDGACPCRLEPRAIEQRRYALRFVGAIRIGDRRPRPRLPMHLPQQRSEGRRRSFVERPWLRSRRTIVHRSGAPVGHHASVGRSGCYGTLPGPFSVPSRWAFRNSRRTRAAAAAR